MSHRTILSVHIVGRLERHSSCPLRAHRWRTTTGVVPGFAIDSTSEVATQRGNRGLGAADPAYAFPNFSQGRRRAYRRDKLLPPRACGVDWDGVPDWKEACLIEMCIQMGSVRWLGLMGAFPT